MLELNRSHKFYTELYASESADRFVRSGLEVLLFSIGLSELDAVGDQDKMSFYTVEKNAWSERLEVALGQLESFGLETDNVDADDSISGLKLPVEVKMGGRRLAPAPFHVYTVA